MEDGWAPAFILSSPTGADNLPAFKIGGAGSITILITVEVEVDQLFFAEGTILIHHNPSQSITILITVKVGVGQLFFAEGSLRKLWRQKFKLSSDSCFPSTRFKTVFHLSFYFLSTRFKNSSSSSFFPFLRLWQYTYTETSGSLLLHRLGLLEN